MNAKTLSFDRTGSPLIGDENSSDFGELGFANLGWDEERPCYQEGRSVWRDCADWIELDEVAEEDSLAFEGRTIEEEDAEELLALCEEGLAEEAERRVEAYKTKVTAVKDLSRSALVREFGFAPESLLSEGRALGRDYLSVVLAGATAARSLGRKASCKVMGIRNQGQTLATVGWRTLFRHAAVLQAAVETARPRPAARAETQSPAPRTSILRLKVSICAPTGR